MDRSGADSGHLLIFDRRPDKTMEERIFRRDERSGDRTITVWGMSAGQTTGGLANGGRGPDVPDDFLIHHGEDILLAC